MKNRPHSVVLFLFSFCLVLYENRPFYDDFCSNFCKKLFHAPISLSFGISAGNGIICAHGFAFASEWHWKHTVTLWYYLHTLIGVLRHHRHHHHQLLAITVSNQSVCPSVCLLHCLTLTLTLFVLLPVWACLTHSPLVILLFPSPFSPVLSLIYWFNVLQQQQQPHWHTLLPFVCFVLFSFAERSQTYRQTDTWWAFCSFLDSKHLQGKEEEKEEKKWHEANRDKKWEWSEKWTAKSEHQHQHQHQQQQLQMTTRRKMKNEEYRFKLPLWWSAKTRLYRRFQLYSISQQMC